MTRIEQFWVVLGDFLSWFIHERLYSQYHNFPVDRKLCCTYLQSFSIIAYAEILDN